MITLGKVVCEPMPGDRHWSYHILVGWFAAHLTKHLFCDRISRLFRVPPQGFERLRAGALVATTATSPETCALYLGSEVWGTGATDGTKFEVCMDACTTWSC